MSKKKNLKKRITYTVLGALGLGMLLVTSSCAVQLGLVRADLSLDGPPIAEPSVLSPMQDQGQVSNTEDWIERRKVLQQALVEHVYGPYPKGVTGNLIEHRIVDEAYAEGAGRLEEFFVQAGENGPRFHIGVAIPNSATAGAPVPLIIAQSFCQNSAALKNAGLSAPDGGGVCGGGGIMASLIKGIFGQYIEGPPVKEVLERGYAYATIYSSQIAADSAEGAHIGIELTANEAGPEYKPEGVLSVWAAGYGWVIDILDQDNRFDPSKTIVWGHSRQGKAALWATANDDRIDGVISHQSGTGGATLSKSLNGESIKQITENYPHWFNEKFASYSGRENEIPVDQHFLIALAAPRPVFLGNSWNDVWSDPNGTFRAAQGADEVYKILGANGLVQTGLKDNDITSGELVFQISKGRHGIRPQDWEDFLSFLDARFSPKVN